MSDDVPCPSIPRVLASIDLERRLGLPVCINPAFPHGAILLTHKGKTLVSFVVTDAT